MQAIPTRPHVQGSAASLELGTTEEQLTDGAGLVPFRALWDRLNMGAHLNDVLGWMRGRYRPALQIEQWLAMLVYGGTHMDHLPLLETRGVRALFGWERVVNPTSFGRFVRQGGKRAAQALDETLLGLVRARWDATGKVPRSVMLMFDSTVVLRYGVKQAGAEVGYNPRKRGRPSHHPHLAFLDTGDCMGVRWRPGKANCAEGLEEWVEELVSWLRAQGVEHILVRLDKGYFKVAVIEKLKSLGVSFVMKMQESNTLQRYKGPFSPSAEDPRLEVSEGERWGIRMLCVRETAAAPKGELALGRVVVEEQATVLTNIASIDPITAWRMYNQGAQVEHRIEEMGQLGVGRTAVDHLGGNHLLWSLGALAYQMQHFVRTAALDRTAEQKQVRTLRALVIRTPGKLVRHARRLRLKLMHGDPVTELLQRALARIARLRTTPLAT